MLTSRRFALLVALALFGLTAGPTLAIGDPNLHPLPFTPEKCRQLIERGAPFTLGGPDTDQVCIIIEGGKSRR